MDQGYERYCDQLVQLLPAEWTLYLADFDTSPSEQIGVLQSTQDQLAFFAPDPEKVIVQISRAYGINLSVRSGMPMSYNALGLQRIGELRNSVPSGGSAIATIRERARVYKLKSLKADMLFNVGRSREAAEMCNGLVPEPLFCNSAKEAAARALPLMASDANKLYHEGRYEEALIASTLAIQKTRNGSIVQDEYSALENQFQERALIEAALGQIDLALLDFYKAAAIKSALPPNNYDTLQFQEAIVLYMYGAPSAGEQACAQAGNLNFVTDVCARMQKAGAAISHLEPDEKTGHSGIKARYSNLITFNNPSDFDVVIKLLGPSSQGFTLLKGKDVSLAVPAGEYRILLRYAKAEGDYVYAKGRPFTVVETSTAHSETKVALPKHPKTTNESRKQFEESQVAAADHPVNEVSAPASANGDFHFVRAITGSENRVISLAFSQDSRMLAVASSDNIKIWEADSGIEIWHSGLNSGRNVAFSPDGKFLALEHEKGAKFVIQLIEPTTNQSVRELEGARGNSAISFSPDGRWLAFARGDTIQVSEVSTGRSQCHIASKKDMIGNIAFSPDGHSLASGGKNGVAVWQADDGKELKELGAGDFVAISPDGQMIASASSQDITLRNLATGQTIRTLKGKAPMLFSQDGRWLASRSADGRMARIWNVVTGQGVATLGDPSDSVTSISFSPDGQWLASASEYDTVWLWRRSSNRAKGMQVRAQVDRNVMTKPSPPESGPTEGAPDVGPMSGGTGRTAASGQGEKNMLAAPMGREKDATDGRLDFEVLYRHGTNGAAYGHLSISKAGLAFKTEIDPAWEFNASCWEVVETKINHDRNEFHIRLSRSNTRNFIPYISAIKSKSGNVGPASGSSVRAQAKTIVQAISEACGRH
jgi:WD40 repeat protein